MPVQVSYPGVYIQELPSGVRTITGVATSITAFVGRTARGATDTAVLIHSQGDYDRTFGGLSKTSPLSFGVRDFFANGGSSAVIVRLFKPTTTLAAATCILKFSTPAFTLAANSPGSWGKNLTAVIDLNVSATTATAMGVTKADLFNLTITDTGSGVVEVHRNLTFKESARRIDRVLPTASTLVKWDLPVDPTALVPAVATAAAPTGGDDGVSLTSTEFNPTDAKKKKIGLYALEQTDLFNILVIPPEISTDPTVLQGDPDYTNVIDAVAVPYAESRRAIVLVDPPKAWTTKDLVSTGMNKSPTDIVTSSKNAQVFFPRLYQPNPFNDNRYEPFVPSGAVAGIMARTDTQRGVWKAPAGLETTMVGVPSLAVDLTDLENGDLNPIAVNCLRNKVGVGRVVWGSRTLQGDDRVQSDWKYIPVRRTALYIEESVFRGTQWVVFEPNDEPLWAQIRTNVGAFMQSLFLQGAFQGLTPQDAYFVKCDKETTTQDDINKGIVNILVGFAPLKPAEFVVISLQQMAGQTS
jgi:Bacteriophage tail sheath protein